MKHQSPLNGRSPGFTLIELMITILIASILMAVAVPSFRSMVANSRLSSQTMDLVGAVNIARSEAIKRNGTVTLCRVASDAATACESSSATWGFWMIRSAGGTIVKRDSINTYGGTLKVTSTLTNDAITFGSDGLAHDGTAVTDALISARNLSVCTTRPQNNNNIRTTTLGLSSRISTVKASGTC